jgi:methionyl-tRNA synthetase
MLGNFSQNMVPRPDPQTETELDHQLQQTASTFFGKIEEHLHRLEFHRALETIFGLVQMANQYIDKTAPWTLAKDPAKAPRLQTVLFHLAEALRFLTYALSPFIPSTAEIMKTRLGLTVDLSASTLSNYPTWGKYAYTNPVSKGASLFPKKDMPSTNTSLSSPSPTLSPAKGKEEQNSCLSSQTPEPPIGTSKAPRIGIEEFQKVQLKIAKVLEAERVPKSSKLLKLQVDLGTEQRQIVAGIGKKYAPEELVGKTIVVVANLKPAKLMGIESQGMVLAAGENDVLGLLGVSEDIPVGTKVK